MKPNFWNEIISGYRFRLRIVGSFLLLLLVIPLQSNAQKLVQDTLFIPVQPVVLADTCLFRLDCFLDERPFPPNVLGRLEKNVYWFVPVDLLLATPANLCDSLFLNNPPEDSSSTRISLKVILHEFRLAKKSKSMFSPRYQLNSRVSLFRKSETDSAQFIGQLFCESIYPKPFFGDKPEKGFSRVIENWQQDFVPDVGCVTESIRIKKPIELPNFHNSNEFIKPVNLLTGGDAIFTTSGYMVDGEILFSEREALPRFFRTGYNLRYRHEKTFESIQFGMSIDYIFFRRSRNILLNLKSQLMYGFNRWNDFETTKHKIYDAFILNYSLSQKIIYNQLHKQGLTFGAGIVEDVYYIYSKQVKFQPGIIFYLGLKL